MINHGQRVRMIIDLTSLGGEAKGAIGTIDNASGMVPVRWVRFPGGKIVPVRESDMEFVQHSDREELARGFLIKILASETVGTTTELVKMSFDLADEFLKKSGEA